MKTTSLLVEYLIAGLLVAAGLGLVFLSCHDPTIPSQFPGQSYLEIAGSLGLLTGFAYGLGIVSESAGQFIFDKHLDKIKFMEMAKFIDANRELIYKSQLLKTVDYLSWGEMKDKRWEDIEPIYRRTIADVKRVFGRMQFRVRSSDDNIAQYIDSGISRMRVVRTLLLAEWAALVALALNIDLFCLLAVVSSFWAMPIVLTKSRRTRYEYLSLKVPASALAISAIGFLASYFNTVELLLEVDVAPQNPTK